MDSNEIKKKFFRIRGENIIKSIIKEDYIEYSNPISIGGENYGDSDIETEVGHESEIETIIENDEVVGIIHHCQCGKSTEIRFDY